MISAQAVAALIVAPATMHHMVSSQCPRRACTTRFWKVARHG
jgi:hypothetical protein